MFLNLWPNLTLSFVIFQHMVKKFPYIDPCKKSKIRVFSIPFNASMLYNSQRLMHGLSLTQTKASHSCPVPLQFEYKVFALKIVLIKLLKILVKIITELPTKIGGRQKVFLQGQNHNKSM